MSKRDQMNGIRRSSLAADEEFIKDIQGWKKRLEQMTRRKINDVRFTHWIRKQPAWHELPNRLRPEDYDEE